MVSVDVKHHVYSFPLLKDALRLALLRGALHLVAVHALTLNLHVALMLSDSPQERRCVTAFFSPSRGSVGLFEVSDKEDPAMEVLAATPPPPVSVYSIDTKLI